MRMMWDTNGNTNGNGNVGMRMGRNENSQLILGY